MRAQNARIVESADLVIFANSQMRGESSSVASNVEDEHLSAEAVDERLDIVHRIDIKIDV
jgi:hypothetical protein